MGAYDFLQFIDIQENPFDGMNGDMQGRDSVGPEARRYLGALPGGPGKALDSQPPGLTALLTVSAAQPRTEASFRRGRTTKTANCYRSRL